MQVYELYWLILLVIFALPVIFYHGQYRKAIFKTDSWTVYFRPSSWNEVKALFVNLYPDNENYLKYRKLYRLYAALFIVFLTFFIIFHHTKSMEKIKIGSTVPAFILPDQDGNLFDISTVLGQKNLVIYFYPKDDSPGCTKEACYFQDQFEVFKKENALVIGISGQSVESHKAFAQKYKLTYTLLSDEGNDIRKLFGVPTNFMGLIPGRVTYIVNKKGKVVYLFDSQTEATKHVDEALRILKLLRVND